MSRKALLCHTLPILLLAIALLALAVPAEAGCEYARTVRTTYYAYFDPSGWQTCHIPAISPQVPYTRQAIGEEVFSECDSSYSSWGDTTTCTDPENVEVRSHVCGLICD